jgi:hypothetical protein
VSRDREKVMEIGQFTAKFHAKMRICPRSSGFHLEGAVKIVYYIVLWNI